MDIVWIAVIVVLAIGFLAMIIGGRKKRWEKVTMADGDVMCVYRTSGDYWFRDKQNMTTYHRLNGGYVKLNSHFTLKREEINESQVESIETEIRQIRAKKEEEDA